ncbi:PTS transporter subunit IIC [uncultured Eubacterium sp.]|uniref:PTS transporter subunit IIC n=1 Tax=uncultured Eubacterium sp. TaxID=165185 RepID=UPI002593FBB2|nr:PTS sugar transporter subunit IIC [uncultured Eubacterium sp.]
MKKVLNHIFIDGLSGMALGLFSTLIIGTIIGQIGNLVGNEIGTYLIAISNVAKTVTGAGIGVGVAAKFKQGPLVTVSAAVAGMIGAFPTLGMESFALGKAGEPLGAFVAALIGIECGRLVAGRTKIDIILTPLVSICTGAAAGFIVGPPISNFMKWLGNLVNINVEASPILGGIAVSVLMGMILTLPISSAALGVSMGLTGLAAGAATIGCCCQMVGFAVASYRENKFGGFIAQGIGTSMLQVPNILRRPLIWLPPIISSAILGPIASAVLHMVSTPIGSGMGSAGFVGQIAAYGAMLETGMSSKVALIQIVIMHFILPAVVTLIFSEGMRKAGWIKDGDMKLEV